MQAASMPVDSLLMSDQSRFRAARTLVALFVAAFVLCANSFGHGGGTDADGCHFDSKTGKRHCHGNPKHEKSVCDGIVPAIGDENVLHGRVVSVTDGDTFKAKIQGAVMVFRMADIDAPEMKQPYGHEAREGLKDALDGKDVVMLRVDTDSHGRIVAHVWIGNLHINREVVSKGAAWFYPEYAHDDCLFPVENEARDARRGLWMLPREARVEPWTWREQKRETAHAEPKKKASTH